MRIIIVFVIFTFAASTYGQVKEKNLTHAEEFSLTSGILLEKQFFDIGTVKGVEVQVIKFKDLNSGKSQNALKISTMVKGSYSTSSKATSLDAEEIEDLIKSLNNLKVNIFPTTRDTYTEVTFRSKTGFEAGAYYTTEKGKWIGYVQVEKYDRDSMVLFNPADFDSLLALVEKAKQSMH